MKTLICKTPGNVRGDFNDLQDYVIPKFIYEMEEGDEIRFGTGNDVFYDKFRNKFVKYVTVHSNRLNTLFQIEFRRSWLRSWGHSESGGLIIAEHSEEFANILHRCNTFKDFLVEIGDRAVRVKSVEYYNVNGRPTQLYSFEIVKN